jgi:hypothetical protein
MAVSLPKIRQLKIGSTIINLTLVITVRKRFLRSLIVSVSLSRKFTALALGKLSLKIELKTKALRFATNG